MIFTKTKLQGAFVLDLERREDNRGFFARAFCQDEFEEHGLKPVIAQANIAYNRRRGCVRGMHFQSTPGQAKLVRVAIGKIYDVAESDESLPKQNGESKSITISGNSVTFKIVNE